MKHSDVTIIIQGPIIDSTFFALAHYCDIAKIVFSFMCNDQVPEFLKKFNSDRINVVTYFEHEIHHCFENNILCSKYNSKDAINEIYSIKKALDIVETKYCVKTRSNQLYKNIDSFISKIKNHDNTVCSLETSTDKFEEEPYFMPDNLYGSNTELLKNSFSILWEFIENKKINFYNYENFDKDCCCPQQYLSFAILNALTKNLNTNINKDIFEKLIKKINFTDLGD